VQWGPLIEGDLADTDLIRHVLQELEVRSVLHFEDHPQCAVSPYGESKLFAERVLRWYGEAYGLNWLGTQVLGPGFHCGDRPAPANGWSRAPACRIRNGHQAPMAEKVSGARRSQSFFLSIDFTLCGS